MASQESIPTIGLSMSTAFKFNERNKSLAIKEKTEALKEWKRKQVQMDNVYDYLHSSISVIHENDNLQLLNDLTVFIRRHAKGKHGYIPTAQIKLGMNVSDNGLVAELIEKHILKQQVASGVVLLSSQDCSSFSLIKDKIAAAVITGEAEETFLDGHDKKNNIFRDLSYGRLALIRRSMDEKKPIVVIIEDIESCSSKSGLKPFLATAQKYLEDLNLVILFGSYSGCFSLQQILSSRASDALYLNSFHPKNSRNLFEEVMSRVLLAPEVYSFKLSPKCLRILVDNFVLNDVSTFKVMLVVKLCIFQHFHSNPLSSLTFVREDELHKKLDSLNKKELLAILKHMTQFKSMKGVKTPAKNAVDFIKSCYSALQESHRNLLSTCTYLYLLTKTLHGNKLGSNLSAIFISFLGSKDFGHSYEVEETMRSLRFLSLEDFKEKLELCVNNGLKDDDSDFGQLIRSEYEALKNFGSEEISKPKQSLPKVDLEACKTRAEWKEKLKKSIAETPKVLSKFEMWRIGFVKKVKRHLQQVSSPMFLPLNEAVYFNDHQFIVDHCFPCIRSEIVEDLRDPLVQEGEKQPGGESDLDISRIHQLIQESAAFIDLHECLDSFKTLIEEPSSSKRRKTKAAAQEENNPRFETFVSAINDLEFIGVVQKDKRKPDVLTKVTWD